jgi:8-amino-7-oxononanoate synthase
MIFTQRFEQKLAQQQDQCLLRKRTIIEDDYDGIIKVNGKYFLNFAGNDYLGLRHHQGVLQSYVEGLSKFGSGSGASPLVTGHSIEHNLLEDYLAEALNREAVLLFSSGFAANQTICHALLQKQDSVLCDKLMHASFIEGAASSAAQLTRFAHNDMAHAAAMCAKAQAKASAQSGLLLATEGVFSMDGDQGLLPDLAQLAQAHDAMLMVDDAHGFGVLGDNGFGSIEAFGLDQQAVPIVMGTFGKAVATSGAFIAGSQMLIDYLVNSAKHYIYSTAMSAANARATLTSLEVINQGEQRARLQHNITQFKNLAQQKGIALAPSDTAIQPVVVGDPALALKASEKLKSLGIWVTAIRTPTVPPGKDRLRITLSAIHQDKDIEALVDSLALTQDSLGLNP